VFDKAVAGMQAEATAKRSQEIAETGTPVTPELPPITPLDSVLDRARRFGQGHG